MSDRATGRETPRAGTAPRTPAADPGRDGTRARLTEPGTRAVAVLLLLAILLFAMMLRGAHILVTAAGDPAIAAIQVATFLSSLLLAGLLLGGMGGIGAIRGFAGHDGTRLIDHAARRTVLAVLGGLVAGVVAGGAAFLLEGELKTTDGLIVGASIAVAALVGGLIAALRPGVMGAAGLTGTIVVIGVLALRSFFLSPLTRIFGGEGTREAFAHAQSELALVSFLVAGVAAGIAAHLYIRSSGNRLRTAGNMAAGAAPGVLALIAQMLTWIGDGRLISSAGGLDLGDAMAFQVAGPYQINGAVALLFSGALVAVLLYGRTRGPRQPRTRPAPARKPEWAEREERRAAELDRAGNGTAASGHGTARSDEPAAGSEAAAADKTPDAAADKTADTADTAAPDGPARDDSEPDPASGPATADERADDPTAADEPIAEEPVETNARSGKRR
ncbi:MAG: hypothetical protein WCA46_12980 [Actinocatenispora sp.]